jgi:hypothetical protein
MSLIQHALEFGFCDGASPMGPERYRGGRPWGELLRF